MGSGKIRIGTEGKGGEGGGIERGTERKKQREKTNKKIKRKTKHNEEVYAIELSVP